MKPEPAPHVPGTTEFEGFDNVLRAILMIPKEAKLRADEKWRRARTSKKRPAERTTCSVGLSGFSRVARRCPYLSNMLLPCNLSLFLET